MIDERTDIGSRLRAAREARGVSLRQIADSTKLSVSTLEALERGQVSRLPGGIYRRAIVRAFAQEIGLDPEATLQGFLAQHPDDLPPPSAAKATDILESVVEVRSPRRGLLQAAVKLIGAAVPVIAGIYYFTGHTTPSVPARQTETRLPARPMDLWTPEIVPAGGFSDLPSGEVHPVLMRLTMSASCVLRVMADGQMVLARRVEAGEQFEVALTDEVVLSGDDAGALQFSINGQAGRLLGPAGEPLNVRIGRDDYQRWLVAH